MLYKPVSLFSLQLIIQQLLSLLSTSISTFATLPINHFNQSTYFKMPGVETSSLDGKVALVTGSGKRQKANCFLASTY